ncbi:unnamed protein product [Didymodactylos carnosus]|uniref:Importin N-terminal domain-containing protein n=1 Tax=Didymodactylos carnosus TaxID=1234261 RepID=A0A814HJB2_9BILA|nr:unnamed protein product [Didymodactylos carnosus]CAF3781447.1 unnamed protein product [Didymodactylos carnosus]
MILGDENKKIMQPTSDLHNLIGQTLSMIITPDQQLINKGQQQLASLELLETYTLVLTEISVDNKIPISIRQLAGVLLRKYISKHWTRNIENFIEPEVPEEIKCQIRKILPSGLQEPNHRLRVGLACVISAVAEWDCPEAWPELLPYLINSLKSQNKSLVHGTVRVLTEIVRDLDDKQIQVFIPLLLPEMYRLIISHEQFNIRIRTRCVSIFTLCISLVHDIATYEKQTCLTYIVPFLSPYCDALKKFLVTSDSHACDTGFRIEIIRAFTLLFKSFPKLMQQEASTILQSVWNCLTQNTENYVATVIYKHGDMDAAVDSDGETLSFECLIYSLFEFVQYDSWSKNVSRYVEDESDDSFSHSVRLSALELLLSITSEFKREAGVGLWKSVHRHLSHAETLKSNQSPRWWKLHEACLLAMGRCKQLLTDMLLAGFVQIDLDAFVKQVPLADLNQFEYPYLVCQAALFAGRFSRSMSAEINTAFLDGICHLLMHAQHPIISLSSLRAFYYYCEELGIEQTTDILKYLPSIFDGILLTLSRIPQSTYIWPLESLAILISVDEPFVASVEDRLSTLAIEMFVRYVNDPLINSETTAIIKGLVHNNLVTNLIQERLIPVVESICYTEEQQKQQKIATNLPPAVLDLLTTVLRSMDPPINRLLMEKTFPIVLHLLLTSDDQQILLNGGECLCAFLSCASKEVLEHPNSTVYILQILAKFLNPKMSENCCTFVGKLIRSFIRVIGNNQLSLGDTLVQILKAVLAKLQGSSILTVQQSLIVVFAHLIHSNIDDVINFLTSMPGPNGGSAFDFVMQEWTMKQHLFYGPYDIKVSIIALSCLLEHAMTNNDVRFQTLVVPGDQVIYQSSLSNHQGGPSFRTRSKTTKMPEQWTSVPLVVKLFKILVLELQNQINTRKELKDEADYNDDSDLEDDSDDGGEENSNGGEDEGKETMNGSNAKMKSSLNEDETASLSKEDEITKYLNRYDNLLDDVFDMEFFNEKDPDALLSPIMQIDLLEYLKERIRHYALHPWFAFFRLHLNLMEKQALQKIGINVN